MENYITKEVHGNLRSRWKYKTKDWKMRAKLHFD